MSLDVCLSIPTAAKVAPAKIFLRENGSTREVSREEWEQRFPGTEPVAVVEQESDEIYSANITHNLGVMADAAGIYSCLWLPDENGITHARQLIEPLTSGLARLKADPKHYETFNAKNGWGLYKHFVPFVEKYLAACIEHPDAEVSVSR